MHALVEETELAAATVAGIGGLLRSVLQYAVQQDLLIANPAHELTRPVTPKARDRRFSEDSLRVLWPALVDASTVSPRTFAKKGEPEPPPRAPVEPATAVALRLLGLTLLRRSELAGGKWFEIDMRSGLWTIPASRMKAQREHVVPLSKPALALLRHLRTLTANSESIFILPAVGDAEKHMDPRAITRGMSRTIDAFEQPAGSPHDLRRTAATWLTSHGVRRFVVSWLLARAAHEGAEVTAIYDKNEYLDERLAALELWGQYLDTLAPPPVTSGNVVRLGSRGGR